jgi:Dolichyl-phosphate-mannose-protein mannosyltransferase
MSSTLVAEPRLATSRASSHRAAVWTLLSNPWVIAGMALLARVAYMAVLKTWVFSAGYNHFAFGYETGSIARSIAEGKGFASPFRNLDTGPTAWIAPLYPYFCAGVFKLFGVFSAASAIIILGTNCIVSALTVVPLFRVGDRIFGRSTAILTAWIWALVPYFMCWPAAWIWEIAFSAFLVVALVQSALDLPDAPKRLWLRFGALGGITILVNPALLTVLPVAALWAVWRSRTPSLALRRAVLAGLVSIVVFSPWMVRNRVVLGKWVFVRDNFAFEFAIGNFPGGSGMGWSVLHPAQNDRLMNEYATRGEIAFLAARADYPKNWMTRHTREFAQQTLHRFTAFWDGTSQHWTKFPTDIWRPLPFFALTVLALLGCLLAVGNRISAGWLIGFCCLLYPWPYYLTYAQTRYRHAIEPLLVLLAAYFGVELAKRAKYRFETLRSAATDR